MKKLILGVLAVFAVFSIISCGDDPVPPEQPNETPFTGFTLTVTDLPSYEAGKGYAASLMRTNEPSTPVATALGNGGVFQFYVPDAEFHPTSTPFKDADFYNVGIALVNLTTFQREGEYVYMDLTNQTNPMKTVDYTNNKTTATVSAKDFYSAIPNNPPTPLVPQS